MVLVQYDGHSTHTLSTTLGRNTSPGRCWWQAVGTKVPIATAGWCDKLRVAARSGQAMENTNANILVHSAQADSVLSACGMTHVAQTPLLGDVTCPECLDVMVKKMASLLSGGTTCLV